ncbi:sorbosone dehydrogenase [Flavobacterium noncentrifugens]|uniref:Glucose/arabinose dehydrogenase, beta-propeller fold n=1 Tax=Flavobacterium noncentrifugens TaxID=1128970 RepID=A0A1G8YX29_9FLAO|nr:sorbosone dehydrogenase family protein [Flavobacterium noncentrifugens]GEP51392.1 sorbosone dehydrogenase [Flavobacterium noncentrifugens]SDK07378.1 Glucose/arabinose dehydrogenase, beta-propeller fold [Flavobacterium noncentrifugens]
MKTNILIVTFLIFSIGINAQKSAKKQLPAPYATKSVTNYSNVIGWKDGETPKAPQGFTVTKYADGFDNPRWMYAITNGDVLVAQSNSNYSIPKQVGAAIIGAGRSNELSHSADVITLLRDTNNDGKPDVRETFATKDNGLNQPFGMLVIGDWFYVANTDALLRFPYKKGQTKLEGKGEKLLDLPAGKHNRHWSRNLIANADNSKIYIAVGSGTNVAEEGFDNEINRADILEVNPDGSGLKIYASGLRNPVGMDWAPETKTLWTAVNERDELGNNLVPDYLTSVKQGGFYGWPYSYWGQNIDPRVKPQNPNLVKKTIVPEVDLGSHTASLGLAFYTGKSFPDKYKNGAFIAQHGSWNRDPISGYKVVFVPFKDGKPSGKAEDFLTGFVVDANKNEVHGRPVGVIQLPDGSLLLTDDKTNNIWQISYSK